ncbi:MAG: hypothetical protein KY460_09475 [Actinobacteria bacterium]|nr:hypothetical protein [Actinomycetota bacterium]
MAANAVPHSNGSEPIRFVTRDELLSTTTMAADIGPAVGPVSSAIQNATM